MVQQPHPFHFLRCPWWWIDATMVWWIGAATTSLVITLTGAEWSLFIVGLMQMATVAWLSVRFNFERS